MPGDATFDSMLAALRAVGEPTRLRLLCLCAHNDLTVSELVQILGQSQPRISRHLKLLCEAGLLERRSEGNWAYFRVTDRGAVADLSRHLVDLLGPSDTVLQGDLERLDGLIRARIERADAYFAANAARWHDIRSLHVDDAQIERCLIDAMTGETVDDLLDIGTGTGRMVELLAPHVGRAIGIDQSRAMLQVARATLERHGIKNGSVQRANMYSLPMAPRSFDGVVMHQVLHYAERPAEAIAEAGRVLRDGAPLAIVDFARHERTDLRDNHAHRWLGFDPSDVAAWAAHAGLAVDDTVDLPGGELTVLIWILRRPPADTRPNRSAR
ncbi:MAG: metalloregulator ArsR/SmtB family transcription factor [Pseudomonadota bacterium]